MNITLKMRNLQENIPPWKKEVLMRRDGLSKAVEQQPDLSMLSSLACGRDQQQLSGSRSLAYFSYGEQQLGNSNGSKQQSKRYRVGSSSSAAATAVQNQHTKG